MYCRKCGKEIPNDSFHCPYCGEEVLTSFNQHQNSQYNNRYNGYAVAGFITAFISPILGWIFGSIGLKRAKNGYRGRYLAIAAIIIATFTFAYNVYYIASGQLDELLDEIMKAYQ